MTREGETYAEAARERDLLRAGVDLAVPKLDAVQRFLRYGDGDRYDLATQIESAKRDLTVGVS